MSREIIDLVQSFDHNYEDVAIDDIVLPPPDVPAAEFGDHINGICGELDILVDGPSIGEILYRLFDCSWMGTNKATWASSATIWTVLQAVIPNGPARLPRFRKCKSIVEMYMDEQVEIIDVCVKDCISFRDWTGPDGTVYHDSYRLVCRKCPETHVANRNRGVVWLRLRSETAGDSAL